MTIFPPYIIPNGTYERIKKFSDTLPLRGRGKWKNEKDKKSSNKNKGDEEKGRNNIAEKENYVRKRIKARERIH